MKSANLQKNFPRTDFCFIVKYIVLVEGSGNLRAENSGNITNPTKIQRFSVTFGCFLGGEKLSAGSYFGMNDMVINSLCRQH